MPAGTGDERSETLKEWLGEKQVGVLPASLRNAAGRGA
jgi:hypothetical protein